jgi:hypothetical protein
MSVGPKAWLFVPLVIAGFGIGWMQTAVMHYERTTGREAYGLAGVHYSTPEWGFEYHPGGQAIHRWTTIVPGYVTLATLGLSLLIALGRQRKSGWRFLLAVSAVHVVTTAAFALVVAGYDMTVTGVFI